MLTNESELWLVPKGLEDGPDSGEDSKREFKDAVVPKVGLATLSCVMCAKRCLFSLASGDSVLLKETGGTGRNGDDIDKESLRCLWALVVDVGVGGIVQDVGVDVVELILDSLLLLIPSELGAPKVSAWSCRWSSVVVVVVVVVVIVVVSWLSSSLSILISTVAATKGDKGGGVETFAELVDANTIASSFKALESEVNATDSTVTGVSGFGEGSSRDKIERENGFKDSSPTSDMALIELSRRSSPIEMPATACCTGSLLLLVFLVLSLSATSCKCLRKRKRSST